MNFTSLGMCINHKKEILTSCMVNVKSLLWLTWPHHGWSMTWPLLVKAWPPHVAASDSFHLDNAHELTMQFLQNSILWHHHTISLHQTTCLNGEFMPLVEVWPQLIRNLPLPPIASELHHSPDLLVKLCCLLNVTELHW